MIFLNQEIVLYHNFRFIIMFIRYICYIIKQNIKQKFTEGILR